jgi:phospholipid/cholesterol/gamma-HCH transport system substrate-binding protein
MKKKTSNKIGLGIFVSAAIAIFILGIYLIGERRQLFRGTFKISTVFKNVSGLQLGNNVRFSGIDVGIVSDMAQLTDTTVKVDMQIDERSRKFMRADSKASIGTDGLMGDKLILIAPGTEKASVLKNNDVIVAVSPINMDDVFIKLKKTGDNLASITTDLASITQNVREGKGTIGMLFTDTVFAQNLAGTIINVRQGAQGFKRNMDAASNSFLLKGAIKKKQKEDEKKEKGKEKEPTK